MDLTSRRTLYIVGGLGGHIVDDGGTSQDARGHSGSGDATELRDRHAGADLALHILLGRVVGAAEVARSTP
ncbi:hypothetical protein EJB05_13480, partial [Eragrostis curvula]